MEKELEVKKEKKVAVRALLFDNVDEALNKITEKKYTYDADQDLITCQTELPKKIRVMLQGTQVLSISEIPVATFDFALFAPVDGETEEQSKARVQLAQKTVNLVNAMLEKESLRLAKAEVMPANFEQFLDNLQATRSTEITVDETKKIVTEWLRVNNKANKERGKTIFFDSASKLIDCIKSQAHAMQVFAGSPEDLVLKLVNKYYEALKVEFKSKEKSTVVLDKWFNGRVVAKQSTVISLDDLDDMV